MAPGQEQLLENLVDEALRSNNFQPLDLFLEEDLSDRTAIKCSKQFLVKVDRLVNMCLDHKDAKHASLCFTILPKCGKKLSFPGCLGPSEIIAQGYVKKMADWFEKCRQLWIQQGPQRDEALLTLAEDFFDSLMAVHEISKEATYQVTDIFLHPIGQVAAHPIIYILIKKEAIRKLNMVLDKIPDELKKEKKILSSQQASDVMTKLAGQMLDGGDYDFQTALMEALCRMATASQRRELVHRWFSMDYVAKAFIAIRDSEFETDCRTFLNLVNGMQGDSRRVYSYPCLEAFLDEHELLMPPDEKLVEFWIDFNLGSQSISFYFAPADEGAKEGQWDTICITENEVHSYTLIEEAKCHVLRLRLCEEVCVGTVEGACLTISFSPALDILQAVRAVYGHRKNKGFVGKSSTSVVKTTVKILMEDSCSQPVVPESQVSLPTGTREGNIAPCWLAPPPAPIQLITPARRRTSESATFISWSAGGSDASPCSVVRPANTLSKGRELITVARTPFSHGSTSSSTRKTHCGKQIIPSERSVAKGTGEEDPEPLAHSFVPDSQPTAKSRGNVFSNWHKHSVTDMLMMPVQTNKCLSNPERGASMGKQLEPPPSAKRTLGRGADLISHKRLHSELSHRLQDVINQLSLDSDSEAPAGLRGTGPPDEGEAPRREAEPRARRRSSVGAAAVAPPGSANRRRAGRGAPGPALAKETSAARKAVPAKVLQDRTPNPKVKPAGVVSGKEKKDAQLADNMVKLISSRYDGNTAGVSKASSMDPLVVTSDKVPLTWVSSSFNKSILQRSWLPSAQKEAPKAIGFNKSLTNPRKRSTGSGGDIFVFKSNGPSHIGGKHNESSALETSSSMLAPRSLPSKKGPLAPKGKRHVQNHLFSDTDTDKPSSDVSWLRDSSRRPKPKVSDYTRKAPAKMAVQARDTAYESPDLPFASPKKDQPRPFQKKLQVKEAEAQPERRPAVPSRATPAAGRRPQRATATKAKSYREPDTDDSLSETGQPPAAKKPPSVKAQTMREQARDKAERKKNKAETPAPCKPTSHQHSHGRVSHTDKELPAPSKECTAGRQAEQEKTQSRPSEAKRTSSAFTKQPTKTHPVCDTCEVGLAPGPKTSERAVRGAAETKTGGGGGGGGGGAGRRPNEQMSVQKASWTSRLAARSPCPPPVEKMRSAARLTPAPAISPLSPLLITLESPRTTSPDDGALHHRGRGGPAPRPPCPVVTATGKGGVVSASVFYGGPRKRGSAATPPVCPPPQISTGRTPTGRPAAKRGLRAGCGTELSPIRRPLPSAAASLQSPSSLASQPVLTSTALDEDKAPSPPCFQRASPAPGDSPHNRGFHLGSSKESPGSSLTLSLSSVRSSIAVSKVNANSITVQEKTPSSTIKRRPFPQPPLVSGPSLRHHPAPPDSSSDTDEEEHALRKKSKRTRARSPKMKPRKLFKSSAKAQAGGQRRDDRRSTEEEMYWSAGFTCGSKGHPAAARNKMTSRTTQGTVLKLSPEALVSTTHTLISRGWEARADREDHEDYDDQQDEDPEDQENDPGPHDSQGSLGVVCRQLSAKLQRKVQTCSRGMERYSKQSAQTAQRHVASLSAQVNKYRAQRLECVRQVLHEEISHLEAEDSTLKNMEKELTVSWRKQSTAFHSYLEKENRSYKRLKDAFQNNKIYSLECEEKIFTSQMRMMMRDMKCVQDRLFKEMQEQEIHSVRRGLQALFMPETAMF